MNMESYFKMPSITYAALFFAIAFASGLCNAFELVNIDVTFSDGASVSCNSDESNGLTNQGFGFGYVHLSVPIGQREICHAWLNNSSAMFTAYDPQYDQGHPFVYWVVKQDGIYHSWDNNNFVKKAVWNVPPIVEH
jgi:hypothetical protein